MASDPTPRIPMRVEPVFDDRTLWKLVAILPRSRMVVTFAVSIFTPLTAVIEIGTFWMFSDRFWAVTMTSSRSGAVLALIGDLVVRSRGT